MILESTLKYLNEMKRTSWFNSLNQNSVSNRGMTFLWRRNDSHTFYRPKNDLTCDQLKTPTATYRDCSFKSTHVAQKPQSMSPIGTDSLCFCLLLQVSSKEKRHLPRMMRST